MKGWVLLGSGGLPSEEKNQFCAKKICNSEQVLVLLPILQHKNFQRIRESGGDYPPPVLEVGDLSPAPPPAPTPMISPGLPYVIYASSCLINVFIPLENKAIKMS